MTFVAVIGDALLDVQVTPSAPVGPGGDVPAAIRLGPGGQGANLAVRLARRGLRVRLGCALGTDTAGRVLRDALDADGVEIVELSRSASSGVVVIEVAAGGERTMLSQRVPLLGADLAPGLIDGADWLVVSGYALLEPGAGRLAGPGVRRRAIIGCSLDAEQSAPWLAAAASVAPHLVVVNVDEARVLCGSSLGPDALPEQLGRRLGGVCVVTHAAGASAAIDGRTIAIDAPAGDAAVDTTGAGDAFAAGLIAGLLMAAWPPPVGDLRQAMADAAVLASAVARSTGAQAPVEGERPGRQPA